MTADLEAFLRAAWPDWDTFTSHMQDVLRAAVEHGLAATPLYKAGAEAMKAQAVTLVRRHATAPDGLIYAENADAVIRGYNMAGERILARVGETERTIIELRRQHYSNAEIAERTGWNIRRVQRFLKDLQDSIHESGG